VSYQSVKGAFDARPAGVSRPRYPLGAAGGKALQDLYWARLEKIRWPDGVVCPYCQVIALDRLPKKSAVPHHYNCQFCKKRFNAVSNTFLAGLKRTPDEMIFAFDAFLAHGRVNDFRAGLIDYKSNCTPRTATNLRKRVRDAWRGKYLQRPSTVTPSGTRLAWRVYPYPPTV